VTDVRIAGRLHAMRSQGGAATTALHNMLLILVNIVIVAPD